jgi:hypothetical protein
VAEQLPCESRARARLAEALAAADDDRTRPERARSSLRLAVGDLLDDLAFTPVKEADLPQGFPGFAAVDEVELRDYPAYRMVRTTMRGGAMGAFWPLFRHIESHGIAMTTPVQMDWTAPGNDERQRAQTMAFLYGSKDLGATGVDGKVEVVDVPAVTVLSIGARGSDSTQAVAHLQQRLEQWLAGQSTWVRAGALRTMGYNSPSVFGDRRYFEVQLPVRRVSKGRILV